MGPEPLSLGYADPRAYLDNRASLGIIAGRVANRIAGSRFELDGKVHHLMPNDGPNHLHGGLTASAIGSGMWTATGQGAPGSLMFHPMGKAVIPAMWVCG